MAEYLVDATHFWDFVIKTPDCWLWSGAVDKGGYGRFHGTQAGVDKSLLAHRVAFVLANGAAPRCVCHRCDNRRCVRPDHLFGGTHQDNNDDMVLKGRHAAQLGTQRHTIGAQHPHAKLTDADIPIIRSLYSLGRQSQRDIAARYGVSQRTIAKVVNRIGWSHV